jgi:hypothetical protein
VFLRHPVESDREERPVGHSRQTDDRVAERARRRKIVSGAAGADERAGSSRIVFTPTRVRSHYFPLLAISTSGYSCAHHCSCVSDCLGQEFHRFRAARPGVTGCRGRRAPPPRPHGAPPPK